MPHRPRLLQHALVISGLSLALSAGTILAQNPPPPPHARDMKAMHRPGGELRVEMRRLWEDHVSWTRLYIVSAVGNLPGKEATAQRLLQNQSDIGNAIKPFYGAAAGDKLTALLKDHIVIATEIIGAAMKGEEAKKEEASKRWTANADEIAVLLSGANPAWPVGELKGMLHEHLALTSAELVAELGKKWDESVAAYDKVKDQMMKMADVLAAGIVKQFPQKAN